MRDAQARGEDERDDRHDDAVEEEVCEEGQGDGREDERLRGSEFEEDWSSRGRGESVACVRHGEG